MFKILLKIITIGIVVDVCIPTIIYASKYCSICKEEYSDTTEMCVKCIQKLGKKYSCPFCGSEYIYPGKVEFCRVTGKKLTKIVTIKLDNKKAGIYLGDKFIGAGRTTLTFWPCNIADIEAKYKGRIVQVHLDWDSINSEIVEINIGNFWDSPWPFGITCGLSLGCFVFAIYQDSLLEDNLRESSESGDPETKNYYDKKAQYNKLYRNSGFIASGAFFIIAIPLGF